MEISCETNTYNIVYDNENNNKKKIKTRFEKKTHT